MPTKRTSDDGYMDPQEYAKIIQAWADGHEIEEREWYWYPDAPDAKQDLENTGWRSLRHPENAPEWCEGWEYRIKEL